MSRIESLHPVISSCDPESSDHSSSSETSIPRTLEHGSPIPSDLQSEFQGFTKNIASALVNLKTRVVEKCDAQTDELKKLETRLAVERVKNSELKRDLEKEKKATQNLDIQLTIDHSERRQEKEGLIIEKRKLQAEIGGLKVAKDGLVETLAAEESKYRNLVKLNSNISSKKRKLETNMTVLQAEKALLQAEKALLEAKQIGLEDEKAVLEIRLEQEMDKKRCQICLSSQKDAMVLPCLHLCYCLRCLETHKVRNNFCPKCRGPINGILKCYLDID